MRNYFDIDIICGRKSLPNEMNSLYSNGRLISGSAGRTNISRGRLVSSTVELGYICCLDFYTSSGESREKCVTP
jgi:hypothetical protein